MGTYLNIAHEAEALAETGVNGCSEGRDESDISDQRLVKWRASENSSKGGLPRSVRDLLYKMAERGITLRCGRTENRLTASPSAALTPELIAGIKEYKAEIIEIMREDQRKREDRALKETGVIQSERQVFQLAREHFRRDNPEGVA